MMATNRTLLEQARELQALAQTGLMYCKDPFDRERYERIRAMAVDMLSTQVDAPAGQVSRLLSAGYPTPKLDTRAAIFDEEGRILMTHENSGEWSLPGGWVDENQSIRSNAVKEVKEETGLTLTDYRFRGIVTFVSDQWPTEYMYLYTATGFEGEMIVCDEGDLQWIDRGRLFGLPMWEGDRIFLQLMDEHVPFFSLKLVYAGDTLTEAVLNGERIR